MCRSENIEGIKRICTNVLKNRIYGPDWHKKMKSNLGWVARRNATPFFVVKNDG